MVVQAQDGRDVLVAPERGEWTQIEDSRPRGTGPGTWGPWERARGTRRVIGCIVEGPHACDRAVYGE